MSIMKAVEEKMRGVWDTLDTPEKAVLRVLWIKWREGEKITQNEIARTEEWLGCHPKYEDDIVKNKRASTLRQVRQIIRNLRVKYDIPILSDNKGYWLPLTTQEVEEYVERMENVARAQAASWHQTYQAVKRTLNVTSSFFDQFESDEPDS